MVDYLNSVFDVIKLYVRFLFGLNVVQGVSIGSIFLVASLLWAITVAFWVRR